MTVVSKLNQRSEGNVLRREAEPRLEQTQDTHFYSK